MSNTSKPVSKLRVIRTARGITQVQLAHQAKVSRFRMWQAESGYIELTPAERAAIARVLGYSEATIFEPLDTADELAATGWGGLQ